MDRQQLEDARAALARRYWEYSYALSKLQFHKEVEDLGTMGVDQFWRVYWDPKLNWTQRQLETVLLHELGHALRDHDERFKEVTQGRSLYDIHEPHLHPMAWNIAGDAEINDDIEPLSWIEWPDMTKGMNLSPEEKKKLAGQTGGVTPKTLNMPEGLPAEAYLEKMLQRADKGQNPITGETGGGPQMTGPPDGQDGSGQDQGQGGQGQGSGIPGRDCGSISGGPSREHEDKTGEGGLSESERQQVIEETENRVAAKIHGEDQQSMAELEAAQSGGKLPGTEARTPVLLDRDKVAKKVNHKHWVDAIQRELYQHLTHAKRSWETPHRRIDGMPGKKRIPKEAVFLDDISGSINEESVKRTFEIQDRFYGRGFKLRTVVCDTQAHVVTDRQARYSGGGTNLGAGLDLISKSSPGAAVVIVVTDGHTPWPETNPCSCPVVVFSWGAEGPDWAKSIPMPGLTEHDGLVRPSW